MEGLYELEVSDVDSSYALVASQEHSSLNWKNGRSLTILSGFFNSTCISLLILAAKSFSLDVADPFYCKFNNR